MSSKRSGTLRCLCEGAVLIAMAQLLGYVKLWRMPWGGSVVLSMVPLVFFAVRRGIGAGLGAGLAFGVLQFLFDGGFVLGWQSIIGDYLLAYTAVGLAGLTCRKENSAVFGTLIGGAARWLVHVITGATVWAAYMPDRFFGMPMTSPLIYSVLYNLAYMLPNVLVTLIVFLALKRPLRKWLMGGDLK